jgi:hypothetical protein
MARSFCSVKMLSFGLPAVVRSARRGSDLGSPDACPAHKTESRSAATGPEGRSSRGGGAPRGVAGVGPRDQQIMLIESSRFTPLSGPRVPSPESEP